MLMVVFGAGASYDSFSDAPPGVQVIGEPGEQFMVNGRPPLANQLFGLRFANDIALFPECKAVIPYLRPAGVNVENELEKLQNESETFPEGIRQLAAIRYYLQYMLTGCQAIWEGLTKGLNNYKTLLDIIARRRRRDSKVCMVTFNYDTLLEEALSTVEVSIKRMSDYIAYDYQLIKLHGSVNWGRVVENRYQNVGGWASWDVVHELIKHAGELKFGSYMMTKQRPISTTEGEPRNAIFPALAIPVESKQEYTCPEDHIEVMKENLPHVTKLLVVGWRAADKPFLKELSSGLPNGTPTMIVSSSSQSANQVLNTLSAAGVKARFTSGSGGFSHVILSREVNGFLGS